MNDVSRTITGIALIVLGLFLSILAFFEAYFILLYGVPLMVLGFFVFFNKKEDEIEQIKQK